MGRERRGGGGKGVIFLSCGGRMVVVRRTIDPRVSRMPGRNALGFHRPGSRCLARGVRRGHTTDCNSKNAKNSPDGTHATAVDATAVEGCAFFF